MISYGNHSFPGRLFVVEGTDGSGKSTQLALLYQWLKSEGLSGDLFRMEFFTACAWRRRNARRKKRYLPPRRFLCLHATDFADRTERDIIPPLKAGAIVLADRYIYTAFARDVVRGCDPLWVRQVYRFAVEPTVRFFFRAPLEVALERILSGRPELKYYEAGLDRKFFGRTGRKFSRFFKGKSSRSMIGWSMNLALRSSMLRVPLFVSSRRCAASLSRI